MLRISAISHIENSLHAILLKLTDYCPYGDNVHGFSYTEMRKVF